MRAALIAVGSELLRPLRRETAGEHLTLALEGVGIEIASRRVISDRLEEIAAAVSAARSEADLVLVTGGIGPTRDDRTREALARALGRPLRPHPRSEKWVRAWCRRRGIPFTAAQRRQALLPAGARALRNPVGSAPGIEVSDAGVRMFALPGVPSEMAAMLRQLLPRLRTRRTRGFRTATLHTAGVGESRIDSRIAPVARRHPGVEVTTLASPGEVTIQIRARGARASRLAVSCLSGMRRRLGDDLISASGRSLEEEVVRLLARRRLTLATAESCTAGGVSERITSVPGSSRVFLAGAVCYNDRAKTRILSVPDELLRSEGAVSRATAVAMARGAAALTGARVTVAVTGIAGPGGGSREKPVGMVHWAVLGPGGMRTRSRRLTGDRETIRRAAAALALDLVRRALLPRRGRRAGRRS